MMMMMMMGRGGLYGEVILDRLMVYSVEVWCMVTLAYGGGQDGMKPTGEVGLPSALALDY